MPPTTTARSPVAPPEHDLLTPVEIVALNALPREKNTPRAVQRLVRRGHLPEHLVVRLGRRVYLRRAAFLAWARGDGAGR